MEQQSGGSSRSLFLVLIILTQFPLSSSEYPPAPSPSAHPPSTNVPPASTPAPAPGPSTPPIDRNPSPAPSPEAFAQSPPLPPTVSPSPGEAGSIRNDGSVPSEPGKGGGEHGSSHGMRGGQEAGIAVAVLVVAAAAMGIGLVYKKRRENVRRAEHSYAIRRDIL